MNITEQAKKNEAAKKQTAPKEKVAEKKPEKKAEPKKKKESGTDEHEQIEHVTAKVEDDGIHVTYQQKNGHKGSDTIKDKSAGAWTEEEVKQAVSDLLGIENLGTIEVHFE